MSAKNPNPYYCAEDVHDTYSSTYSQCGNKPKAGSKFCGTHSPEARARREAKSEVGHQAWKDRLAAGAEVQRRADCYPDLLAALEAQQARFVGEPNPWGHECDWCGNCVDTMNGMRIAAIAKAKERAS